MVNIDHANYLRLHKAARRPDAPCGEDAWDQLISLSDRVNIIETLARDAGVDPNATADKPNTPIDGGAW